ncbi:YxeA family protein [Companilactobacillus halodurans]|uniref:YxeA family protein n=1 Tax=Companilactobacillus halodurans TaxID=2584183 RepID=A0A5P0ZQV8_9LACO|nr:YxeA family protein [Companilactobacillus halodurans]MQS76643.1 YxeA family protein [Companilactobacillus halodurans]MQS97796.1 YxeA family protein [Companilactobacillus halodurans]
MRSYLRVFLLGIFLLGLGYLGGCLYAKNNTSEVAQIFNKFNILAKRESRYVRIDNKNAKDKDGYGNYTYNLKSYDKKGKEAPISFTGMGKLKSGHYLKIDTKGSYVYTYKEVFKKDIPSNIFKRVQMGRSAHED